MWAMILFGWEEISIHIDILGSAGIFKVKMSLLSLLANETNPPGGFHLLIARRWRNLKRKQRHSEYFEKEINLLVRLLAFTPPSLLQLLHFSYHIKFNIITPFLMFSTSVKKKKKNPLKATISVKIQPLKINSLIIYCFSLDFNWIGRGPTIRLWKF